MGTVKRSPRVALRDIMLHLLAFAVVAFAVQAKLALYKASPEPAMAAAKLSTEKNSAKVFSAIGKLRQTKEPSLFSVVTLQLLACRQTASAARPVHSACINLIASVRLKHRGISLFYRPPPTLV